MAISKAIAVQEPAMAGKLVQIARQQIEHLSHEVDQFIKDERENILKADPSPQVLAEHKQVLTFWLKLFRLLQAIVSPEIQDERVREILEHQIWRLDQSYKMIYEPMPDEEADKILAEAFPDEPRA